MDHPHASRPSRWGRNVVVVVVAVVAAGWLARPVGEVAGQPAPRAPLRALTPGCARLAIADDFGCVVRASGEVWCWGQNAAGQLGDGTRQSRDEARPMRDVRDAVAVAVAPSHTCVLRAGGVVACVGGEGDAAMALRPVEGLAAVDALFGDERGNFWALARGVAHCFGDSADSECHGVAGEMTHATALAGVRGVRAVRSLWGELGSTCLLLADGTLRCPQASAGPWRRLSGVTDLFGEEGLCHQDADGQTRCEGYPGARVIEAFRGAAQLAGSGSLACALRRDGGVRCVGDSAHREGAEGPGAAFSHAIELAVSAGTACALSDAGAVDCWGASTRFSLHEVPGLSGARTVSTSQALTCATTEREARCWGYEHVPAVSQPLGRAVGVTVVGSQACEVAASGALRCPGLFGRDRPAVALTDFGYNYHDEFALSPDRTLLRGSHQSTSLLVAVPGLEGVRAMAVNDRGVCVVLADGRARCGNQIFQGGVEVNFPLVTGVSDARAVASDLAWGCALRGGGEVSCWGAPFGPPWENPTQSPVAASAGVHDAVALSGRRSHVCALRQGGRVSCWGESVTGALATGLAREPVPRDLGVTGVTSLSVADHSMCLVRGGRVLCVGRGEHGSLGDGTGTATPWRQVPPERPTG